MGLTAIGHLPSYSRSALDPATATGAVNDRPRRAATTTPGACRPCRYGVPDAAVRHRDPSRALAKPCDAYLHRCFEIQTRDDNPRTLEKAAEKGSFDSSPVGGTTPRGMKRI